MPATNPSNTLCALCALLLSLSATPTLADDWPQWGRNASNNMVSAETNIAEKFDGGRYKGMTEEIDHPASTKNVMWVVKLGSQTYGNPTIAGGKVFVGTNNDGPHDPKYKGDRSLVLCLDEKTGAKVWEFSVPKLGAGKVSDWEYLGICSSPAVDIEHGRVYVVTNLCEIVCLDIHGLANGNDGPYKDEAKYLARGKAAVELSTTDGDIIWRFDMRDELGSFPHNVTSSSVTLSGDAVFANTSNGMDWSHVNIPNPRAPAFIALNKHTGELIGEEASDISTRILHSSWSSPAAGTVGGRSLVFFGAGDGRCYGFGTTPEKDKDGFGILKETWRADCNPRSYRVNDDGKKIKYATRKGPSEIIASPVFHDGKVYIAIGQDPEHGEGLGALQCIDASKSGDITGTGFVWTYTGINRTISTVSVADGLVYAADYAGYVHCLDANTGELYWKHDTQAHIWGSTLVADGKVYIGNEDGIMTVLTAGKEMKVLAEVQLVSSIYSSPVVANGVLYIATQTHLYAVAP